MATRWYHHFFSRLQVRLLLVILLMLIPIFFLAAYTVSEQIRFASDSAETEALRVAQLTATNHGQIIRSGEQLLVALSQVPEVYEGNLEACNALFTRLREQYQIYTNVFTVDASGGTVCTGLPAAAPVNVSERNWFIRAMEKRGFSVANYELGVVTGRPVVTLSYPVFDADNEIKYQIGASLDLLRVSQYLAETDLPPNTTITAIDRNGVVLYRYAEEDNLTVGEAYPAAERVAQVVEQNEGTFQTVGLDGQERIYAFSPLDTTNLSAFLIVSLTETVAFSRLNELFQRTALMLAAMGMVTLIAGWLALRLFFVRQVQTLVATTEQFASGTLHTRVDMNQVRRTYELWQLGLAFNRMAETLEQREQQRDQAEKALREARDGLEMAVKERTEQLDFLLEASSELASSLDYQITLESVARLAVPRFADWCSVNLLREDGSLDQVVVVHKDPQKVAWGLQMQLRFPSDPNASSGAYQVIRTGKPEIYADISPAILEASARNPEHLAYLRELGLTSIIITPLIVLDKTIGTLSLVMAESGRRYDPDIHLSIAEELARRSAIAIENARLYQQSREYAANEERQRLARDLHDAVSQTLFSSNMIAQALPRLLETKPDRAVENAHQLSQLTRSALAEMRTLLLELRPAALVDSDLGELLQQLAEAAKGRRKLSIDIHREGQNLPLPPDVQIAFYRIAQESLNNIVKHAAASEVILRLQMEEDRVELSIRDNGKGFDTATRVAGMGLNTMRERAEAIGATFSITSSVGGGTTCQVIWHTEPIQV